MVIFIFQSGHHREVFNENGNETDSACEEDILDDSEILDPEPLIPQKVLEFADTALAKLPPRWRNWITRMISGFTLISGKRTAFAIFELGIMLLFVKSSQF